MDWKEHIVRAGTYTLGTDAPLLSYKDSRPHIEPWLSAVLQAEHLSLLLGSGLTTAVAAAAQAQAPDMSTVDFGLDEQDLVNSYAAQQAALAGRGTPNMEDQLSAALALTTGLTILQKPEADRWGAAIRAQLASFTHSVLRTETAIRSATDAGDTEPIDLLVSFLMTFASRAASRERPHIFTTNYDRLIEYGSDWIGLHVLDRFVGTLRPVFRSSRLDIDIHYNPPGIRGEPRYLEGVAKLTKLHGSIDWRSSPGAIYREALPFGADQDHPGASSDHADALMIYPNYAKDLASSLYPYAELLRDFSSAISRPQSVLVCYGYGFGDQHINRVVHDMLSIPSTHLVIASWDHASGRIERFCRAANADPQISLLIGPHFGDLRTLVQHYLPKPAIDVISDRMTEMLRKRALPEKPAPEQSTTADEGTEETT